MNTYFFVADKPVFAIMLVLSVAAILAAVNIMADFRVPTILVIFVMIPMYFVMNSAVYSEPIHKYCYANGIDPKTAITDDEIQQIGKNNLLQECFLD